MKKKKSLTRHILVNHFRLTAIIVSIIIAAVIVVLCILSSASAITEAKMQLSQDAQSVRFEMEQSIERANYIAKNDEMLQELSGTFSNNYEQLRSIKSFNMFMDSFEDVENAEREENLIYLSNPHLLESKYLRNISRLDNLDEIKSFYQASGRVFYWHNKMEEDAYGEPYMLLYRIVPMDSDCVIEVKNYFGDLLTAKEGISKKVIRSEEAPADDRLTFSEPLGNDFVLTMRIDRRVFYRQCLIYFVLCLIIGVIFLISALILAVWSVNRTMKDVLEFVRQVESGELTYNKSGAGYIELETIGNKINELITQIDVMNRDKYESKLLQNKLEIELLNAKINPHILYNSLSAIKLTAFKTKNTEIDEMLDELIAYYRLVLNKGEELITVDKELEYLEKYVAVNEMAKKISYDFDVDVSEDVFDTQIPHILLQPIVENAIKYGRDTDPCISIKFYSEGERVVFEISDNGTGVEPEKLEELNRFEGLGYGLKNVIQRLEFYCGDDYSLKFLSNEMGGTTVMLKMLRLKKKDED